MRGVVARGAVVEPDRVRGAAAAHQRRPPGCFFELGCGSRGAAARRVRRRVRGRSRTGPDSPRARRSRVRTADRPSASHARYTAGVSQPKCGAAITRSSGGSPTIGSMISPRPRIHAGSAAGRTATSEPSAAASDGGAAELPQDRGRIGRPAAEPRAGRDALVRSTTARVCADGLEARARRGSTRRRERRSGTRR